MTKTEILQKFECVKKDILVIQDSMYCDNADETLIKLTHIMLELISTNIKLLKDNKL